DRQIDARQRALPRDAEQVLARRLAASGWLVAAEAQEIAHGLARCVVARERRAFAQLEPGAHALRRRKRVQRLAELRRERSDLEQRMGFDREHARRMISA